ncbi:MAG: hypothetical protein ACPGJV_09745 [Bacteriovoracaceae bacterium]
MKLPPYDRKLNILHAPHLVVLGAGASKAACPNGDSNNRHLPLMDEHFVKTVGMTSILDKYSIKYDGIGFESLFSSLYSQKKYSDLCREMEDAIFNYFSELRLPDVVTIYDYLVCSLRAKDTIATFNWDSFLIQAYRRNGYLSEENMPDLLFLHGNVGVGICEKDKKVGPLNGECSACKNPFSSARVLLFLEVRSLLRD